MILWGETANIQTCVRWASAPASSLLKALALEDLSGLTDRALGDELVEITQIKDLLESEFIRRLRRFADQGGYAADGPVSLVSWLRVRCRLSAGAASQKVEMARHLPELPTTSEALASGEIGYHHAAVIARAAEEVGPETVAQAEPVLLKATKQLDPGRLRIVARHLRHCADPNGTLRDANLAHDRRWFQLSQTWEGMFVLNGMLDAEGGVTLKTA